MWWYFWKQEQQQQLHALSIIHHPSINILWHLQEHSPLWIVIAVTFWGAGRTTTGGGRTRRRKLPVSGATMPWCREWCRAANLCIWVPGAKICAAVPNYLASAFEWGSVLGCSVALAKNDLRNSVGPLCFCWCVPEWSWSPKTCFRIEGLCKIHVFFFFISLFIIVWN